MCSNKEVEENIHTWIPSQIPLSSKHFCFTEEEQRARGDGCLGLMTLDLRSNLPVIRLWKAGSSQIIHHPQWLDRKTTRYFSRISATQSKGLTWILRQCKVYIRSALTLLISWTFLLTIYCFMSHDPGTTLKSHLLLMLLSKYCLVSSMLETKKKHKEIIMLL